MSHRCAGTYASCCTVHYNSKMIICAQQKITYSTCISVWQQPVCKRTVVAYIEARLDIIQSERTCRWWGAHIYKILVGTVEFADLPCFSVVTLSTRYKYFACKQHAH
jgi:hypothetical protein